MPERAAVVTEGAVEAAQPARVKPAAERRPEAKVLPPYAVVLHNDDINGFPHVIRSLGRVFGYGGVKSMALAMRAHVAGRAAVWTGAKEHAEFKADRLRGCGPDPVMVHKGALPLKVTIEPVPG